MLSIAQTTADPSPSSRRKQILDLYEILYRRSPAQLLGVPPHADARAVRGAFQSLVKRFHPDAFGPLDADLRIKVQAVFMQITSAYQSLLAEAAVPAREGNPVAAQARVVPATGADQPPVPIPASTPAPADTPQRSASAPRPSPHQRVQEAIEDAQASLRSSDAGAAIEALHEVLRLAQGEQRTRVRLLLAAAYLAEPDRRRYARALLSEIAREEPSNAEALALLGSLYFREGLLARAEATLARAVAANPGHLQARASLRAVRDTLRRRETTKEPQNHWGGRLARLLWMAR